MTLAANPPASPDGTPSGRQAGEPTVARERLVEELTRRAEEAEETLRAIRAGEVDALVVGSGAAARVFTLQGADFAHRVLLESMSEGALTLTADGTILYANRRLAEMVGAPHERVVGAAFASFIHEPDRPRLQALLDGRRGGRADLALRGPGGALVLCAAALSPLAIDGAPSTWAVVVTDVTLERERARAERDRYLAELRFQAAALANISDAVVAVDDEKRVTYWGAGAERLFGVPAAEALGRPAAERFRVRWEPPETEQAAFARLGEGGTWRGENIHVLRSGEERHLEAVVSLHRGERGEALGLVSVLRDVTERKQAEAELWESREAYRALAENSPDGVTRLDRDSRYLFVNAAGAALAGLPREALLGRTSRELGLPEPAASLWEERIRQVFDRGEPLELEEALPTAHGSRVLNVRCLPERSREGEVVSVLSISRDITLSKQAEAALQRSEERLRLALQAANAGTWEWDLATNANLWSEETWRLYGLEPDSVTACYEAWAATIHPDDRAQTVSALQETASQGAELSLAWRVLTAEGERWLMSRGKPIVGADGSVATYIGIVLDVTEQKRLEGEREQHLALIKEANEAKDLFLNTLSHELRTPLAAMLSSVEVLKSAEATKGQRARVTALLERNIKLQTRLIDDLLDLSRIVRKKVELVREPLDLRQVVAAQLEEVEVDARRARLSVEVQAPAAPVRVSADAVRLGQVVTNLLTNAIKYTEPGGAITVTVAAEGAEAVVRVRDTGVGIAPDLLPHIFDAFRQAETSLARSKGGLGIGLAVARPLAELHGGRLECASDGLGKGSEFTLRLPLGTSDAPGLESRAACQGRPGLRVLVVDDGADLRESMAMLLELLGHRVSTAADGKSALERARAELPDLVLVDIGLPDIDGYEVARTLRADAATRGLRLVALTGYASPEHRDRSLAAGFDLHLAKPLDAETLQRALDGGGVRAERRRS